MASFVVLEGANRGAVFLLLPDSNRLGRDPLSEVVVLDDAASRVHAQITWDLERAAFHFEDKKSRNGSLLNGLPCTGAWLSHGDELRVGATALLFVSGDDAHVSRSGGSTLVVAGAPPVAQQRAPRKPLALELAPRLIGRSPSLVKVLEAAARLASHDSPVLILGETGTGKELLAQALHRAGPRCSGPLVCVNAANLEGSLCESELFGHERGAFTGADARRAGCLERADGGTLFLDEVGELPAGAQAKLLRALDTRRFTRLGGSEELEADFRLLAATNRDLDAQVAAGTFRQDLLYRLDVVRLELPPLRDRPGDVALLVDHFLAELGPTMGSPVRALSDEALALLGRQPFPGNVRELRNVIERALIFADDSTLNASALRAHLPAASASRSPAAEVDVRPLAEVERAGIEAALTATDGNKTKAAQLLGIDRKTLYAKIERHGL